MESSTAQFMTYAAAIAQALREEMERDPRVVLLSPSPGGSVPTPDPHRPSPVPGPPSSRLELPVGEPGASRAAIGAALAGLRPVVEWPDAGCAVHAMAAVMNQAAATRALSGGVATVPVVFRAPLGVSAADGKGMPSPEGWFSSVPGLKVVLPSTPRDARGLLKSAIRDDNPVLFFEHARLSDTEDEVPDEEETIPIGSADVKRAGSDVSIVTYSAMVQKSLAAAALLAEEGIDAEVLDLRSSLPLDEAAILDSVGRTGRLVIVQEAYSPCSIASEVAALVAEKALYDLDAPIRRVTARWAPVPFAPELERAVLPQTEQIVAAVREILDGARE